MHVKGGFIHYTYNGAGSTSGTSNYTITITIFYSCTAQGPRNAVYLGIFNASTYATVLTQQISTTTSATVSKTTYNPCMSDPPSICYEIYTYVYTTDLPDISAGYILAVQDAYRTSGIINITNSSADGISVTANIPGTIGGVDYHKNSSPNFLFGDTAIVCYKGPFTYQFGATDADGDSLSYEFGNGLNMKSPSGNASGSAPETPPYPSLTYTSGYSGAAPLGSGVTINPTTGLISGTAPSTTGEYVIAVYVKEWRKGVLMDSVKKELQIYVYDCSLTAATLNTSYLNCGNYTFSFENESSSSSISSYLWNFGVPGSTTDTSTQAAPTYTYADTGTYTLKLYVATSGGCTDSASSVVKVYPGFSPGFTVAGSCYQAPFTFTDTSYVKYGSISSWSWNFGDSDTSSQKDPTHQYSSPDTVTVTLAVTSTEGCSGTVSKTVVVSGKPDLTLPFTDTLICSIDSLPLKAVSDTGVIYKWTPAYNIIHPDSADPVVYPKDTTVYTVTVTQKGCVDSAHVTVDVLQYITVSLPADTTVCATDSIRLDPVSYALAYRWSPATGLSDTAIKYPLAAPASSTTYTVIANLGKCQATASEYIKVVPYPSVTTSGDTTICYGDSAKITAVTTAAHWVWAPDSSLYEPGTLQPVAHPAGSTTYLITVTDTLGCPKSVSDSVTVAVTPKIVVSAGDDTSIVIGQPLQLDATANQGITFDYAWTPADWLSNAYIYNPVATITSSSVDSITYTVTASTAQGCKGSAALTVTVYSTLPDIFVPSAFTPNGDGHNDLFKPIAAGISSLRFFRVYDRWGQLVFATSRLEDGWDGTLHQRLQPIGAYVYMIEAVDYKGKIIFKKGTVTLER
ncbi:PKD domain-containing protein [Dinghuibacter silviterrae]|uniref:Gliding motility-associated-like protein n=1 Tax=Dinghuibacter silviterrae TaxID=1539049 RepID=A0A4R8DET0_9BACT|nr:PKD domain-containing protein [Dinghuibacter silviterrae]TDW96061.1 gliding motility-associated-like protein [Dinghuibacter silviterrae]